MLIDTPIVDYHALYFQTVEEGSCWTEKYYHLVAQSQPYPSVYEVKEPYKNEWFDEDGDDEYTAFMFRKSFEFKVKFYVRAFSGILDDMTMYAWQEIEESRRNFRERLISDGEFRYYDSWHQVGFRGVRYVKDEVEQFSKERGAWMIFSVTFKVNDPYPVTLSNNELIDA